MDLELLQETLAGLGEPAYRARQVWSWAARGAGGYAEMSDLPLALREELSERVPFSTLTVGDRASSRDGTRKVLLYTGDGRPVETVLMSYRDGRASLCISSQSGCPLTCTFCATGQMRFFRNLSASEILDQALYFRRVAGRALTNCVFMGMGEPLMNVDAVLGACERLPEIGVGARHTTVSTVGWIPGIERLAASKLALRLAFSLHAPEESLRSQLMPVNDRYPLADVLAACRAFYAQRRRRVFIEYVMLAGVNDSYAQALQLAALLRTARERTSVFKVNLIPYNPAGGPFEGSSRDAIAAFRGALAARGVPATVRMTRGRDIAAACGQLAAPAVAA
ncbi:MAG TPA: 23S rRNA (adenine(2503)-C(2))-methyltransferase RlmN [Solirubrobacteraceae bacterium]|nr:23S rRNA (adenine(2503)-C(2))-methyltransferase RlmN [Solirubrobacteraceae bacterium]